MTDGKPPPSAASRGPIAKELAEWLRASRSGWTESVPEPLSIGWRRLYACAGSFTWLVGFVLVIFLRDSTFFNFVFGDLIPVSFMLTVLVSFSIWFGWIVAFAKRPFGPVRLFLNGLLLPTATVSIIGFSVGRLSTSAEPTQPSSVVQGAGSGTSGVDQSPPFRFPSADEGADSESSESPEGAEGEGVESESRN